MGILSKKLRIGEKIGFGFGIVGVLFLGVVWQYHHTLHKALTEYRQLYDVYGARRSQALAVESNMLRGQRAEKNFILTRDEVFIAEVLSSVQAALNAAADMPAIDGVTAPIAEKTVQLIKDYERRFQAVAEAWRIRGLDHDSGLQGDFRDSIHELEDMAGMLDVDRLYLLLLQIRRGEKDLGLRREDQYRGRVQQLIRTLSEEVSSSRLGDELKADLLREIETYRDGFARYAAEALNDLEIHGGKGPFRQTAHRIEALLESHYLSGLAEKILQVRRREKDYLLRHEKQYVDMALAELDQISTRVGNSAISAKQKKRFNALLNNYRRDFLALVAQDDRISQLSDEMRVTIEEIVRLAEQNVRQADRAMTAMRLSIDDATGRSERLMLWVIVVATLLGAFLAVTITLPIVRPLRKMAGLLDQVAAEESAERMPYFPGGRDEVNAMAGSVNAIADHKVGFITWWKAAMHEADACKRLEELMHKPHSTVDRQEAYEELRQAIQARQALLWENYQKVHQLNEWITERAEGLLKDGPSRRSETALNTIRYCAKAVQTTLEMTTEPRISRGDAK